MRKFLINWIISDFIREFIKNSRKIQRTLLWKLRSRRM